MDYRLSRRLEGCAGVLQEVTEHGRSVGGSVANGSLAEHFLSGGFPLISFLSRAVGNTISYFLYLFSTLKALLISGLRVIPALHHHSAHPSPRSTQCSLAPPSPTRHAPRSLAPPPPRRVLRFPLLHTRTLSPCSFFLGPPPPRVRLGSRPTRTWDD